MDLIDLVQFPWAIKSKDHWHSSCPAKSQSVFVHWTDAAPSLGGSLPAQTIQSLNEYELCLPELSIQILNQFLSLPHVSCPHPLQWWIPACSCHCTNAKYEARHRPLNRELTEIRAVACNLVLTYPGAKCYPLDSMKTYTQLKVDFLFWKEKQPGKLCSTADPQSNIEGSWGSYIGLIRLWPCLHLCHSSFMIFTYRKQICGSSLCHAAGALPMKLGQSPNLVPFLAQEAHSSFFGNEG